MKTYLKYSFVLQVLHMLHKTTQLKKKKQKKNTTIKPLQQNTA